MGYSKTGNKHDIKRAMLKKVDIESETGCWFWTGSLINGSPMMYTAVFGKQVSARKLAMWAFTPAMEDWPNRLGNICRERTCVNPKHSIPWGKGMGVVKTPGSTRRDRLTCPLGHTVRVFLESTERPPATSDRYYRSWWRRKCPICRHEVGNLRRIERGLDPLPYEEPPWRKPPALLVEADLTDDDRALERRINEITSRADTLKWPLRSIDAGANVNVNANTGTGG